MAQPFTERMQTFVGGMSQAIEPELLQNGQYAFGVNMTSRGGLPHTRPVFADSGYSIPTGKFQGAALYRMNGVDRIVYGVAGSVYVLNLSTGATATMTSTLSTTADRFYFVKADRYFVVQDGDKSTSWAAAKWPVIIYEDTEYDQSALRASNPEQALPKGGPMAYGHGRLFVATDYVYNAASDWTDQGRVGFIAGDIKLPYEPESLLSFIETWTLSEGGRFDLPEELGFIQAMSFQHNVMTGIGQGPLIIIAEEGCTSAQVNVAGGRAIWKNTDFSVVQFRDVGTLSPHSLVHNNSDILFRAKDGLRSLSQTASTSQGGGIANVPMSAEVEDLMKLDTLDVQHKISAAKYDNRVLFTNNPNTNGFKSLVSFDVNPLASAFRPSQPIYDGVWTGFEFLHVLNAKLSNVDRLWAFIRTEDGLNGLYYIDPAGYLDGTSSHPVCRVYTAYKYFNAPFNMKKVQNAEIWVKDVRGQVDLTFYFRPDGYPFWTRMSSGTVNSDPTADNMSYRRLRFEVESPQGDAHFQELLDSGYAIQFCVQWTGFAKVSLLQVEGNILPVDKPHIAASQSGTQDTAVSGANLVDLDDYAYRVV